MILNVDLINILMNYSISLKESFIYNFISCRFRYSWNFLNIVQCDSICRIAHVSHWVSDWVSDILLMNIRTWGKDSRMTSCHQDMRTLDTLDFYVWWHNDSFEMIKILQHWIASIDHFDLVWNQTVRLSNC